ncbi:hypothetical protein EVAR_102237_1 [Eumeta japonica]|uniref:Uncharacterized protein n=1 Tax=Eumeta variegata TaxID=151549 RepID=A0A4C1WGM4_EUMVA|nr:hypothetical protein EVAR_102237_1 [Eumeta japonica]
MQILCPFYKNSVTEFANAVMNTCLREGNFKVVEKDGESGGLQIKATPEPTDGAVCKHNKSCRVFDCAASEGGGAARGRRLSCNHYRPPLGRDARIAPC